MSQPMTFAKATKSSCLLRAALFGPSGAGKTFTALRIATGLGGRIAVVDTERGSASKYADRFGFDVLELQKPTIANYVAAIEAAAAAGYRVLVTDSLSHPWHELLQEVDRLASAKYQGNTWSAWSEGTPKQRRLIDAILGFPGHVIATMRSKTEWSVESGKGGKTKPVRVGLAPEQGKGIEYEFDLLLELSQDHIGQVVKDRTGKFQDQTLDKPGEDFGQALAAWLSTGPAPVRPTAAIPSDPTGVERGTARQRIARRGFPTERPGRGGLPQHREGRRARQAQRRLAHRGELSACARRRSAARLRAEAPGNGQAGSPRGDRHGASRVARSPVSHPRGTGVVGRTAVSHAKPHQPHGASAAPWGSECPFRLGASRCASSISLRKPPRGSSGARRA